MNNEFKVRRLGKCEVNAPFPSKRFITDKDGILLNAQISACKGCTGKPSYLEQAGPRRKIFFNPSNTKAAIVTCGGLCPGLNDVIRAVTMVLWYRYGVRNISGLRYGYEGLIEGLHKPMRLMPSIVEDIHQDGGTILGTSRGPQDPHKMIDYLVKHKINILFAIGGDGTQHGALILAAEIERRKLKIAVVGIPKTIDNDISYTDRTFGFETAVAMTQAPITGAHMESKGARNGIGLVKLMGRDSGFIAAHATLASSDVNLLLTPESPFTLPKLFRYLDARLKRKAHAVIVVAEGAGQNLASVRGHDASGNRKLGDIGLILKQELSRHYAEINMPVSIKYIDPSYTIRSVPANANDSVFCFQLGENAVHAAMSGRTEMVVSLWNNHFVHVPTNLAVSKRKKIDTSGLLWQSVLDNTGQPSSLC